MVFSRGSVLAEMHGLRGVIADTRRYETRARRAVLWLVGGWGLCPGCQQSCTGQYGHHLACTRCQLVFL